MVRGPGQKVIAYTYYKPAAEAVGKQGREYLQVSVVESDEGSSSDNNNWVCEITLLRLGKKYRAVGRNNASLFPRPHLGPAFVYGPS